VADDNSLLPITGEFNLIKYDADEVYIEIYDNIGDVDVCLDWVIELFTNIL
jgi:hypothetical protein